MNNSKENKDIQKEQVDFGGVDAMREECYIQLVLLSVDLRLVTDSSRGIDSVARDNEHLLVPIR